MKLKKKTYYITYIKYGLCVIRIPAEQTKNTGIKYFEKVRDIKDIHYRVHDVESYKQRKSRYRTSGFRKERTCWNDKGWGFSHSLWRLKSECFAFEEGGFNVRVRKVRKGIFLSFR